MGQRSIPAPFLMKTYELVDDKVTNDVISWGENGTTFVVWKTADFAKDLLPKYFKHNNFSSFVRQLNTYGFRKIVPDKWEFANDNFKRGEQCLLSEIRRRKTTSSHAGKPDNNQSQSVSGNDVGSTSTSSPGMVVEVTDLSGENEKLRRDNEVLSLELSQAKKQCDELVNFLTSQLKVCPDHIHHILQQGSNTRAHNERSPAVIAVDNDDNDENKRDEGLKLFGVWLKEVDGIIKCGSKRGRCGNLQVDNNNDDKKNNSNNLGLNGLDCGRKFTKTC